MRDPHTRLLARRESLEDNRNRDQDIRYRDVGPQPRAASPIRLRASPGPALARRRTHRPHSYDM
ncbi:hypothetical protein AB0E10_38670 [Streptomyces sp. NPDC048045]|uniref:hypothetical protein n=1 Tax=Streptomyces sp. NPDC048045 TaxID=3154710 RepID=UPI003440DD0F